MKKFNWDIVEVSKDEEDSAYSTGQGGRPNMPSRRRVMTSDLQLFYQLFTDCYPGDVSTRSVKDETYVRCLHRILTFGNDMAYFGECPTLIVTQVPFAIRRQMYEFSEAICDFIYASLNSHDFFYNSWKADCLVSKSDSFVIMDKAAVAQALWKWYYSVFEPVAERFRKFGAEHQGGIFR